MAFHITPVASSPLLGPAVFSRRLPDAGTPARQTAAQAPATQAPEVRSGFASWLATNSAAPAAEVMGGKRTAATSAAASSPVASTTSTSAASSSSTTGSSGLSDFELLFGGANYNPTDPMATAQTAAASAAAATAAAAPPTAQSAFGPNVWMTDPIGLNPDGTTFEYNPIYFATESTAQTVAQMVGGTVITQNIFTQPASCPFVQQQPNYMVQMPSGAVINPGLVASFYTMGCSQSQIDTMIANEVANTPPPAQTA